MATLLKRRSLQDDLAFVERQLAGHPNPLDTARHMWEQRRAAIQEELVLADKQDTRANVALIFEGEPVHGSEEIRLDFATKALDNYQAIISTLVAERAGASLGARGRLPALSSKLFIRDIVRGSVGFILEEQATAQAELLDTPLREAVEEGTRIIRDLSRSGASFEERVAQLSPRTLIAIKKMAKVLHDAGAETKIVGDLEEFTLDHSSTASLYSRLSEVELLERLEERQGTLQGLLPDRRQYEFRPADGSPVFYGPVSEALDAKYLADPASIVLRPAVATFNVISTYRAGVLQSEQWVLEEIILIQGATPETQR